MTCLCKNPPGSWKNKKLFTITNAKWIPSHSITFSVSGQGTNYAFDIDIGTNGICTAHMRNINLTTDEWFRGLCVYIVK